ncbi:MAG: methyltransferase domain-containing protein [Acidobacteria bacterium]|nr:methyltransferase domain-containing protein [Acidobacteriota bacterium]
MAGERKTFRGYGDDLAYIHDAGFSRFAIEAAPELLKLLRRGGVRGGLVVDLGCGSGRWARALSRAGYRVLGVDQSAKTTAVKLVRGRPVPGPLHRSAPPITTLPMRLKTRSSRFQERPDSTCDRPATVEWKKRVLRPDCDRQRAGRVLGRDSGGPVRADDGRR